MILHICLKSNWEESLKDRVYRGDTLESDGYIHCSKPNQVLEVANYIFKGEKGLVLLVIDESKVDQKIKYEDAGNGKFYPHIYGPLNLDSVIKVIDFPPQENGCFELPVLV